MRRLAIIGTGLIGGSIALGLRGVRPELQVIGWDLSAETVRLGLARGALTEGAQSARAAVTGADTVVVAVPVDRMREAFAGVAEGLGAEAVVTDVGSAKAQPVLEGQAHLGHRFVGGHPMAGSERHGMAAATPDLFRDAFWIMTPTATTSSRAYNAIAALASALGARPVALEPHVHDDLMARLSHLPQIVASAVVAVAAQDGAHQSLLGLAANGFRDVTRIAASNPDLWVSILKANTPAVLEAMDSLGCHLEDIRSALAAGDWARVHGHLERSRAARVERFAKPVHGGAPLVLALMIPDRPGVLAEVTTAAGRVAANIEDLHIVHSTEGGRGKLELVVAGGQAAERLVAELQALGYRVERAPIYE